MESIKQFAVCIVTLINGSFEAGVFPASLKEAIFVSILKKDNPQEFGIIDQLYYCQCFPK